MRAKVYVTREQAQAEVEAINSALGYPRVEQGVRVGKGRHVPTITTTSETEPLELSGGNWAVLERSILRSGRRADGAVDVDGLLTDRNRA